LDLLQFTLFCANFRDTLVTVTKKWPLAHLSVTSSAIFFFHLSGLAKDSTFWAVTKSRERERSTRGLGNVSEQFG
jgi:hypothetical protein